MAADRLEVLSYLKFPGAAPNEGPWMEKYLVLQSRVPEALGRLSPDASSNLFIKAPHTH